ncbi:MAG: hypothetical protein CMH48_02900 [Muricauda sp.]|nr:hypothetical protein [Allomuricauda sp.]MAU26026.1 hypothetical protein [Allomuricauda sp.]MBC29769.1 hypothetical protein [Allomuricauda sp.]|tara:strand:- start:52175 stop:52582 length:408 start_codon:yes stop_codon:yes gene_type:complete
MDDTKDKMLEELFDAAMRDVELNTPSEDFTKKVMGRIEALPAQKQVVYQPLISKKVLVLISSLFVLLLGYLAFMGDFTSSGWFDALDLGTVAPKLTLPSFKMPYSDTMVYAMLFLGIMVWVQTSLLKGYFDRKLT